MISLEELQSTIDIINKSAERDKKFSDSMEEYSDECYFFVSNPLQTTLLQNLEKRLSNEQEDIKDYPMLEYWFYELDQGQCNLADDCPVTLEDGTKIPLKTLEDVYNYYKQEYWNEATC